VSSTNGVGKSRQLHAKEWNQFCTPYAKINSKWIKNLSVRPETIKILEESTGSNISDIGHKNIFLDTSETRETRAKINDPNFWDRMAVWIVVFWVVRGNSRELGSRESSGPASLHDEFEMMVGFLGGCLTASEVGGLTLLRERMVVDNVVLLRWQLTWKSKSRGLNLWLKHYIYRKEVGKRARVSREWSY